MKAVGKKLSYLYDSMSNLSSVGYYLLFSAGIPDFFSNCTSHKDALRWTMGRYQKGKTNLDFTEARDSEWQWHQLGHRQVYTLLQTDNHASTSPLSFLQAGCPSCLSTNSVKALIRTWTSVGSTCVTVASSQHRPSSSLACRRGPYWARSCS